MFLRDVLLPVGGQICSRLVSRNQLLAKKYGRMDLLISLALFVCREVTSPGEIRPERGYGQRNVSLVAKHLQEFSRNPPRELEQPHFPVVQRVM